MSRHGGHDTEDTTRRTDTPYVDIAHDARDRARHSPFALLPFHSKLQPAVHPNHLPLPERPQAFEG